jgi:hypothetical protein
MSELQQLSARVSELVELEDQRTSAMEQIVARLDKIESRVDVFEGEGNKGSGKTLGGNLRGGANETPLLKVC